MNLLPCMVEGALMLGGWFIEHLPFTLPLLLLWSIIKPAFAA